MAFNAYLRSLLVSFLFSTRNEMHKVQLEANNLKGEALKDALAQADLLEGLYCGIGSIVECFDTHEEETIENIKKARTLVRDLLAYAQDDTPVDSSNVPAKPNCDDCLQTLKSWAGE